MNCASIKDKYTRWTIYSSGDDVDVRSWYKPLIYQIFNRKYLICTIDYVHNDSFR